MTFMAHDERVVLLGAGASKEAGVPLSFEMTRALVERLSSDSVPPEAGKALSFVCGELMAYDASQGGNPYEGLDVERVFAAVELLARRRELEVTPFVSAWHPAVDVWDRPEAPS